MLVSLSPGMDVYVGQDFRRVEINAVRPHKDRYIVRFDGVQGREGAEDLRGCDIRIQSSDATELSPGAFYHWQILGLNVVSDEGESLGTVTRIIETGANDVYVVSGGPERDLLLPAIESVVRSVDLDTGTLTVTLIPGLREAQD
jgi:16S rRNA processing protein RimM